MKNKWEQSPFQLATGSLKNFETETNLPFSIGGATRQGFEHIRCGISNQDAVNFKIDDNLIIAVLCDGCTSHDESFITDYSSNEIGAKLLAEFITNYCYNDIRYRKNKINIQTFIKTLNQKIIHKLKKIMQIVQVKDPHKLPFLFNMMTSTITITIIREKEYFILHCGDGFIGVNEVNYDLKNCSGDYITNSFENNVNQDKIFLKLVTSGETDKLNNIYMATDGVSNQLLNSSFFKKTLQKKDLLDTGIIDLIPELHLEIINPFFQNIDNLNQWPKDDASLIMIRKTFNQN